MGFVKTKISWGLTHLLRKCDSGEESRGLFFPSGHGFAGGSCRRSTPSLWRHWDSSSTHVPVPHLCLAV